MLCLLWLCSFARHDTLLAPEVTGLRSSSVACACSLTSTSKAVSRVTHSSGSRGIWPQEFGCCSRITQLSRANTLLAPEVLPQEFECCARITFSFLVRSLTSTLLAPGVHCLRSLSVSNLCSATLSRFLGTGLRSSVLLTRVVYLIGRQRFRLPRQ